jgi:uncharacterized protein with von Willebrand factor type A (vWA) domain
MPEPVETLVAFGRLLRERGLSVGSGRILNFVRATAALAPLDASRLYWAARTTLVSSPDQIPTFDDAFRAFFGGTESLGLEDLRPDRIDEAMEAEAEVEFEEVRNEPPGEADDAGPPAPSLASGAELLRHRTFETLSEEERAEARRLIAALRPAMPARSTRRLKAYDPGRRFDVRRTLRRSLKTQGEPLQRAYRHRVEKPRGLVLLLDVSGSMGPYARALMRFGHAAIAAGHDVEVFCFGTRLTRVTREMRARDVDRALANVAEAVKDWQGGTRIGDSLRMLLRRHGQDAHLRGAVVVICSDGLERGDPAVLAAQMARLWRLAYRVVWVNPLKGHHEYQPLARGMAAALPYIDEFVAGHNVASLAALGDVLAR